MGNYNNVISFKGDLKDIDSKLLKLQSQFGSAYDSLGEDAKRLNPNLQENIKKLDEVGVKTLELKGKLQSFKNQRAGIISGSIATDIKSINKLQQELKETQAQYASAKSPTIKAELKSNITKQKALLLKEYNNEVTRLDNAFKQSKASVDIYTKSINNLTNKHIAEAKTNAERTLQQEKANASIRNSLPLLSKAEKVEEDYKNAIQDVNRALGKGVISQNEANRATKNLNNKRKEEIASLNQSSINWGKTIGIIGSATVAYYALREAFAATLGKGIQVNRMMEDNTLGIAALITANTQMVDSQGNALTMADKFMMSQKLSAETIDDIRVASIKTYATFPQLTEIYQQAIGQTLSMNGAFGESVAEIEQNTIKLSQRMSNIAGSIGMPMDKAREEIRSLISGNASTDSLISTMIFGSPTEANKAIKEAKARGANGVSDMLDEILKPFDVLADTDSYTRSMLALEDAYSQLMATASKPVFEAVGDGAKELADFLNNNRDAILETGEDLLTLGEYALKGVIAYKALSMASSVLGKATDSTDKKVGTLSRTLSLFTKSNIPILAIATAFGTLELATDRETEAINRLRKATQLTINDLARLTSAKLKDTTATLQKGVTDTKDKISQLGRALETLNEGGEFGFIYDDGAEVLDASQRLTLNAEEQKKVIAQKIEEQNKFLDAQRKELDLISQISTKTTKESDRREKMTQNLSKERGIYLDLYNQIQALEAQGKEIPYALGQQLQLRFRIKSELETHLLLSEKITDAEAKKIKDAKEEATVITKLSANKSTMAKAEQAIAASLTQQEKSTKEITEYNQQIAKLKTSLEGTTDEKIRKDTLEQIAKMEKAIGVEKKKIHEANEEQLAKESKALKKQEQYRIKALKEKNQAIEDAFKLSTQALKLETLKYELENGEVDKLDILRKELALLESQSTAGLKIFDANKHTMDVLKKQIQIKNEQKSLDEKAVKDAIKLAELARDREYFKYDVSDAQGIYVDYNEQAKRQAEATILALNAEAKKLDMPLLTDKEKDKIKNFVKEEITPSFGKGIADAFNMDRNKSLGDSLKDLGGVLGNIAGNALQDISADFAQTGDIKGAINNFTDSNALRDGLKSSGNPYAMAVGYGAEILSGILTEPMDAFQAMEANQHSDNKAIIDSLSIVESAAFPQLDVAKKSRKHLENIENSMTNIGKLVAFGGGSFATGAGFTETTTERLGADAKKFLAFGDVPFLSEFNNAITSAILGSTTVSLRDSGIRIGSQMVNDFIDGVDAQSYQIIETRKKYLFGLIKSSSFESNFQDLDDNIASEFEAMMAEGMANILESGIALGFEGNVLAETLGSHITEEMKLSLKGKSDAEISELIGGWFGNEFSTMVEDALPIIETFRSVGEDSFTALTRVTIGYEEAIHRLNDLNIDAVELGEIQNRNGDVGLETVRAGILNEEGGTKTTTSRFVIDNSIVEALEGRRLEVEEELKTANNNMADEYMSWYNKDRYQSIIEKAELELERITEDFVNGVHHVFEEVSVVNLDNLTGIGEIVRDFDGSMSELSEYYTSLVDFQFQLQNIGMSVNEVTQNMIDGAGDLSTLVSSQNAFIDGYYTDLEKSELAISAMNKEFKALNLTMPESKDAFREMVENITDDELYGEVITLSSGFADMRDMVDSLNGAIETIETIDMSEQIKGFNDWKYLLGSKDVELISKNLDLVQRDIKEFTKELYPDKELGDITIDNYAELLGSATVTEETQASWQSLGSLLQQQYALEEEIKKSRLDALEEEQKLRDAILDANKNYDDFFTTFNMSDLEKVEYEIRGITQGLGLVGITAQNIKNFSNDIELDKYVELQGLFQQQYTIEKQIKTDRLTALETERDAILDLASTISSTIESLIDTEISRIRAEYESRVSIISSLQSSMDSYKTAETIYSADIYSSIGAWTLEANDSIESSIKTWNSQQLASLQEQDEAGLAAHNAKLKAMQDAENLRVKNHNLAVDNANEQIRITNALADKIIDLKINVSDTFSALYSNSSVTDSTNFYDAVENKDYDNISSLFSTFASSIQESNISDMDAFIKIAYANDAVQNLAEPTKKSELERIEATTIQIADYVSTLKVDQEAINNSTITMYEALIKQNEKHLPNVESEIATLFEQNKGYFDSDSDFYKFLERGATELTFVESMKEQKTLWTDNLIEQRSITNRLIENGSRRDSELATLNKTLIALNNKIATLEAEQVKANAINEQLLTENKEINSNTKADLIGTLQ